jgi:ABC-type glycerol-3-phosphate transport system substrate-binding protein
MLHTAPVSGRLRGAVALSLLMALAACGGGDSPTIAGPESTTTTSGNAATTTTTTGTVLAVTVRGGSVVEGASRQRATLNQPVTVRVTSDVADEVHVHGYDERLPVAAGGTAEVAFVADIPGVFEVELERSHKLLFTLEVR